MRRGVLAVLAAVLILVLIAAPAAAAKGPFDV